MTREVTVRASHGDGTFAAVLVELNVELNLLALREGPEAARVDLRLVDLCLFESLKAQREGSSWPHSDGGSI